MLEGLDPLQPWTSLSSSLRLSASARELRSDSQQGCDARPECLDRAP
jgi:hypothetical protein